MTDAPRALHRGLAEGLHPVPPARQTVKGRNNMNPAINTNQAGIDVT
jgi:hypothetical protein